MLKVIRNSVALGLLALAIEPLAHPSAAVPATSMSSQEISRGEYLAHAADCVACQRCLVAPRMPADADGYATRRGLHHQITPDPATGIGQYSLQDFDRALRRGIARDGHYLYPSMPYPSYAKLTNADVASLYAFFMQTVAPVRQANRPRGIRWPLEHPWPLESGTPCFWTKRPTRASRDRTRSGTAAPYVVQGWDIAGPAIRRGA